MPGFPDKPYLNQSLVQNSIQNFYQLLAICYSMDRKYLEIFIFSLLFSFATANIVREGDFEFFNVTFINSASDQRLANIKSDPNNWYLIGMGLVQLKLKTNYPTSICVDLSNSAAPVTLCQNIQLVIGKKYRLSYSMFCQYRLYNMTSFAFLNGEIVSTINIQNSSSFNNGSEQFFASQQKNVICFNQSHSARPEYQALSFIGGVGGMIDNISILQTVNYINFEPIIQQMESKIIIKTNISCRIKIQTLFREEYQIKCQSRLFQNYEFICDENNFFNIQIKPQQICFLNHLSFVPLKKNPNIVIEFQNMQKYFHYLEEDQKKALDTTKLVANYLYEFVGEVLRYIKYSLCSYFMLSMLSFEILPLLYVFLDIKLVPQFTKQIYYDFLRIYFYLQNFGNFVNKTFSLQLKEDIFSYKLQEQQIPQVINRQKNGNYWLRQFQISSLVIKNNADSFIVLVLLGIKLLLLKVLLQCVGKKIQKQLKIKTSFFLVLLVEFIVNMPCIVFSSFSRILNSVTKWTENLQKYAQILFYFICLSSISLYFIYTRSHHRRVKVTKNNQKTKKIKHIQAQKIKINPSAQIQEKIGKSSSLHEKKPRKMVCFKIKPENILTFKASPEKKKQKQIKKKRAISIIEIAKKKKYPPHLIDTLLILTIPTFVIIGNLNIFFSCVGLIIGLKFYYYHKWKQVQSFQIKTTELLTIFCWLTHHLAFLCLYFMTKISDENTLQRKRTQCQTVILLGLIAIMTVMIGYALQVIKFFFSTIEVLIGLGKRIKGAWHASHRISDEKVTKRENKSSPQSEKVQDKMKKRQKIKIKIIHRIQKKNSKRRNEKNTLLNTQNPHLDQNRSNFRQLQL